ncbi:bifunctional (p)ppGpp synthetase/guanosine-3',5'-bis(diphosphate) 3'-pyrophosphohydrolase [Listeria sp. FSL L7-1517]|uniref:HD domain-containing protein n=1 Tax=Listeria immobilis TaxID=2713502 RepID=UPI00164E154D|nr:HD domain-containing protein [Listeria immobilis]MBC6298023.1 bifunctional (p)ppGpp synthetase/guanosine-3',5'-bis(diphosphate) 3'-pyrophosphohydrolase [Listeria immobilis]
MYEKARKKMIEAHSGQVRKITGEAYFSHPLNVARILRRAGFSEEVVIAGLLHDAVEDTSMTDKDIRDMFGEKVADLVAAHTENKDLSWEERKAHTIEQVRTGTLEEKALIVADKLDNLSSVRYALSSEGDSVWNYFKRGYDKQKWYNEGIKNNMEYGLNPSEIPPFFAEYARLVKWIFKR